MKKNKFGFTMIEVALFLVLTGALFVAIVVGTQNSIFQQRYNDAVQNFAEFLRSIYSQTMNVQSEGDGRSEQAIYGKLVTFGENRDLASEPNDGSIFSYNVIGNIDKDGLGGNILEALVRLDANVVTKDTDGRFRVVGYAENYIPRWASAIQTTNQEEAESFVGALLIVRHPSSGTVYTYVKEGGTIQVNQEIIQANLDGADTLNPLRSYLNMGGEDGFSLKQVDFCVNPNGVGEGGLRRDVRIVKDARNGTGVEIIGDGEGDACGRL